MHEAKLSYADFGVHGLRILQILHEFGFTLPRFTLSDFDWEADEPEPRIVLRIEPVGCRHLCEVGILKDLTSLAKLLTDAPGPLPGKAEELQDSVSDLHFASGDFMYDQWIEEFKLLKVSDGSKYNIPLEKFEQASTVHKPDELTGDRQAGSN